MPALRLPLLAVWLLLIAATVWSWWLGSPAPGDPRLPNASLLLIAFVKVRLVIMHFMEIRCAPLAVRCIADGWCVTACASIVAICVWR